MSNQLYVHGESTIEYLNREAFPAQLVKVEDGLYKFVPIDPVKVNIINMEVETGIHMAHRKLPKRNNRVKTNKATSHKRPTKKATKRK
jgi:hypothetical protein